MRSYRNLVLSLMLTLVSFTVFFYSRENWIDSFVAFIGMITTVILIEYFTQMFHLMVLFEGILDFITKQAKKAEDQNQE